ncbi:MAG: hypothetical protein R6U10_07580 [Thermoplasmatota archaeon]
MERGEKIAVGVLAVAVIAAVGVFAYYELPGDDGDSCGDPVLTVSHQGKEWTYTLCELKDMDSTTGRGGMKTTIGTMQGPWRFKGVSFSALIQGLPTPVEGPVSVTVVDTADPGNISDDYRRTFDAQVLRGNMTVYDASGNVTDDTATPVPILAYIMDGDAIGEEDGPLRVAFVTQNGDIYTSSRNWVKSVDRVEVTNG